MRQIIFSSSFQAFINKTRYNNKVSEYIYKAIRYNNYGNNIGFNIMLTDSEVNYLTFRNDGTISYLPSGKKHQVNEDGTWKRDGRQNGKAAKIIRKLINKKALKFFKDADFETFANNYKSEFNADGLKFELWGNKQIKEAYSMNRCEGDGTLQNSCMNDDTDYLDIYHNCSKLKILVLLNSENKLCGRCLVWSLDDDITLADRIYVTHDWQYDLFLSYITDNKLWRKKYFKTYDNKQQFITPLGEEINKTFKVYTNTDFSEFPYIDTFSYGDEGYLTNACDTYTYNNTDGTRDGEEDDHSGEIYDEIEDEYIDEDYAVQIDRGAHRGQWTHENNTITTYEGYIFFKNDDGFIYVERDGEYYLEDNVIYVERKDEYYHIDDVVYCEDESEDVPKDDAIEIDNKWYHKDSELIVEIDDTWYLKDDDNLIERNGEYFLKDSEEIIEFNGEYFHKDDYEIIEINDKFYHRDDDLIIEIDGEFQLRQLEIEFN